MVYWISDEGESKHTTQVYSWEANESLDMLIYNVQPSASLNSYAFSPNGRFLVFGMGRGSGPTTQLGLQAFTEAVRALQVLGRRSEKNVTVLKERFDGEQWWNLYASPFLQGGSVPISTVVHIRLDCDDALCTF